MKRWAGLLAIGVFLAGVSMWSPSSVATVTGVQVVTAEGEPTSLLRVDLGPGRTSGSSSFRLRNIGTKPIVMSAFKVELPAGGGSAAIVLANGSTSVTVRPASSAGLRLDVTGVADVGQFEGTLSALVGDERQEVAQVVVDRRAANPLEVDGESTALTLPATVLEDPTFDVLLRNTSSRPVVAEVDTTEQFDGPAGPVPTSIEVLWPDGDASTPVQPGQDIPIQISAELVRPGTYTAKLRLRADGTPQPPLTLTVERTQEAPVQILGGDAIEVDSTDTRTVVPVSIENLLPVDVVGVTASVSPLTGGAGSATPTVTLNGLPANEPQTIPKGDVASLVVTVDLAKAGDYSGNIRLVVGGAAADTAVLKVTRKVEATAVAISTEPTNVDVSVADAEVPVRLVLTNESGGAGPVCVTLTKVSPSAGAQDATDAHIASMAPSGASSSDTVQQGPDLDCPGKVAQLPARTPISYTVVLDGLHPGGTYTATFSITDGSRTAVTADATVAVRRQWTWATGAILVGALLAWGLSSVPLLRSKRKRRSRLQVVAGRIASVRSDASRAVASELSARLEELRGQVEEGADGVDASIESLWRQASLLGQYDEVASGVEAARLAPAPPGLAKARASIVALTMDAAARTAAWEQLCAVADSLDLHRAATVKLQELRATITQLQRAGLAPEAAEEAVSKAEQAIAAADEPALLAALEAAEAGLREPLAEALEAAVDEPELNESDPVSEPVVEARDVARSAIEDLGRADLRLRTVFDRYTAARAQLMRAHALRIVEVCSMDLAKGPTPKVRAHLEDAVRAAEEVGRVRGMDLTRMAELLATARSERGAAEKVGANVKAEAFAGVASVPVPPSGEGLGGSRRSSRAKPPSDRDLSGKLPFGVEAGLVFVAACLVAVVGTVTLWGPDLDWGAPLDIIAAVLWGLGLEATSIGTIRPALEKIKPELV